MNKPSQQSLKDELRQGISNAWNAASLDEKKAYSLYELFIFKLILEASNESVCYKTWDENSSGETQSPEFKTGPHQIYSSGYTYAVVKLSNRCIREVHLGIKCTGKSGVEHECDIAVLTKRTADKCRRYKKSPDYNHLLASVECKFYTSNIGIDMCREFIGLTVDLPASKKRNYYVVSSNMVENGKTLLCNLQKRGWDKLVPTQNGQLDKFREDIRDVFRCS